MAIPKTVTKARKSKIKADSKKNRAIIGGWLRDKREAAGLTQSELAKLISRTAGFVQRYESGSRLELVQMVAISMLLKANPHDAIALLSSKKQKTII
jgi:predicted transcriptional regulator